jgi:hypothetical protein
MLPATVGTRTPPIGICRTENQELKIIQVDKVKDRTPTASFPSPHFSRIMKGRPSGGNLLLLEKQIPNQRRAP